MSFLKKFAMKVAARAHVDSLNPNLSPVKRALAVVLAERGIKSVLDDKAEAKKKNQNKSR